MKHIAVLEPEKVPRDAEFHFRDRARVLVDRYDQIFQSMRIPPTVNANTPSPLPIQQVRPADHNLLATQTNVIAGPIAPSPEAAKVSDWRLLLQKKFFGGETPNDKVGH